VEAGAAADASSKSRWRFLSGLSDAVGLKQKFDGRAYAGPKKENQDEDNVARVLDEILRLVPPARLEPEGSTTWVETRSRSLDLRKPY